MSQPIVHFEIAGRDGERLEQFYDRLFGWKATRQTPGGFAYGVIDGGQAGPIDGGIRHEPDGPAEIVLYVQVTDLEAAVARALELGGVVRIEPRAGGPSRFALVTDPEGNPLGLVEAPPAE